MFFSTLVKVSLCAILASVVGVNAQSDPNVTCNTLPLVAVQDCEDLVQKLRTENRIYISDNGQANSTTESCMGKVLFDPDVSAITASDFANNLQPILDICDTSDPMSGETIPLIGGSKFQLFRDPAIAQ